MKAKTEHLSSGPAHNFLKISFEKLVFYFLLLCIPLQVGKHFWPQFSYILGTRVDYLSPTLYLTDILVGILFVLSVLNMLRISIPKFSIVVVFIISLLFGIARAENPGAGVYGLVKLLELSFFGWYVWQFAKENKEQFWMAVPFIFSFGIIGESVLAIAQFSQQKSIGGILYFLGERTFDAQTPGIANASLGGQLVLRPYGTFPHPNVLAAYLLISLILVAFLYKKRIIYELPALVIGTIALFLTLGRVAIILWVALSLFYVWKHVNKASSRWKILILFALFIFLLGRTALGSRFAEFSFQDESFTQRQSLIDSSLSLFSSHPFFGIGLNNFYNGISRFKNNTFAFSSYLQPVHNIYLLTLVQTGIIGFIFLILVLYKALKKSFSGRYKNPAFLCLLTALLLGMTDHYFLTLQSGQLLFFFILGIAFAF